MKIICSKIQTSQLFTAFEQLFIVQSVYCTAVYCTAFEQLFIEQLFIVQL
jgi:hypothetical protein